MSTNKREHLFPHLSPVDARVPHVGPLYEQVGGGALALLDDQGDAAAGRVVADHLVKKVNTSK